MKSIVQTLSDAGIYVLLDFHQDALSEKFCGEGAKIQTSFRASIPEQFADN
jgi:hypothetical protein